MKRILIWVATLFFLLWVGVSVWGYTRDEIQTADDVLNLVFSNTILFSILIVIAALSISLMGLTLYSPQNEKKNPRRVKNFNESQKKKITRKYEQAMGLMQQQGPSSFRSAIITMDALLDYCLGVLGFKGSLGEKLQKAEGLFSDIDDVWKAHKYRNKLVHDLEYEVYMAEAVENMELFTDALRDLGAI